MNLVTELNEFELGRLYERRETRDQLLALSMMKDDDQRNELLTAWLIDLMESLPDSLSPVRHTTVIIEETTIHAN